MLQQTNSHQNLSGRPSLGNIAQSARQLPLDYMKPMRQSSSNNKQLGSKSHHHQDKRLSLQRMNQNHTFQGQKLMTQCPSTSYLYVVDEEEKIQKIAHSISSL